MSKQDKIRRRHARPKRTGNREGQE
jgi:hypothetical protein